MAKAENRTVTSGQFDVADSDSSGKLSSSAYGKRIFVTVNTGDQISDDLKIQNQRLSGKPSKTMEAN